MTTVAPRSSRGTTMTSGPDGLVVLRPAMSLPRSGTIRITLRFDRSLGLPFLSLASSVSSCGPDGSDLLGIRTHSPRLSALTLPISVLPSVTVTSAFGAARPAITASPSGLTRTTSNEGRTGSLAVSGAALGALASGSVTAFAKDFGGGTRTPRADSATLGFGGASGSNSIYLVDTIAAPTMTAPKAPTRRGRFNTHATILCLALKG